MNMKKTIVAVDDSNIVLKMLEEILSDDYDFHGFSKGMRALQYLKNTRPDLIILDVDMPEIDGYEMLRLIRERYTLKSKSVPVIFLTSNNDKEHVVKAVEAGANDYAVKPVSEDILMTKIENLLEGNKEISWDNI
ncbi:MAG: response regulator [Lachnospiraceae bacterium]|nr:response regulator [Lachnospiraceae bacterium]